MPARRRSTSRAAALQRRRATPSLTRLAPSGRSLLIGIGLLAASVGAYLLATQTSLFAVRTIDVRGGSPVVRAQVRAALAPERGRSLVVLGGSELSDRLGSIPGVASFAFDRGFPHTLRVTIRAERPVLVLRAGKQAYLVSSDAKVLRSLAHPRLSSLPRVWLPAATQIAVGQSLTADRGGDAAAAAAAVHGGLGAPVRTVTARADSITLTLGTGFELRLGDAGDLRLKLAIARRIVDSTDAAQGGSGYLDVSVPERPVLNTNPQVTG